MKTRSVFLLSLTLGFSFLGTQVQAQFLESGFVTNGLVAYFPFNRNANNETGLGHNGRVFGATLTQDRFGILNSAYFFNGSNNWIETDSAIVTRQTPITFSFWAKSSSSAAMDVLGMASPVGSDQEIRIMFSTGQLHQKGLSFKNSAHMATYPFTVDDATWHHYVMVMGEGTQYGYFNFKAYGDGNLIALGENFNWGSGTYDVPNNPLTIGKHFDLGSYFSGCLDDIRVYNRALSALEVQQLYASEVKPQPCSPHHATATVTVVNGFVVAINLTDRGCGYTNAPSVKIVSATGTGATATATIEDGLVTSITVDDAGYGYTAEATVQIESPPFTPWLEIAVIKVRVAQHVVIGRNYVLESSADLVNWAPVGQSFMAADELLTQELDVAETGRYFRIFEVP